MRLSKLFLLAVGFGLLPCAAAPSRGSEPTEAATNVSTLSVEGAAERFEPPDQARVRLGTEFEAKEADDAQTGINRAMNEVLAGVRKLGIAQNMIRTLTVELQPVYESEKHGLPQPASGGKIVRYHAANVIEITVTNLSQLGKVIDASVKAGANRIEGVSFELRNERETRLQALATPLAMPAPRRKQWRMNWAFH